eukprot:7450912-Karenia_brevis.AAC.1
MDNQTPPAPRPPAESIASCFHVGDALHRRVACKASKCLKMRLAIFLLRDPAKAPFGAMMSCSSTAWLKFKDELAKALDASSGTSACHGPSLYSRAASGMKRTKPMTFTCTPAAASLARADSASVAPATVCTGAPKDCASSGTRTLMRHQAA